MKVFIADDEVIVRIGMKSIIDWQKYGHEVIGEAENGEEAYNKIVKLHPDLVITDIKMPVTDGIELIKQIKEYDPGIKIIVLSGYGEYNLVRDAMKLGADDYLLKLETDPKKLIKLIAQLDNRKTNDNGSGKQKKLKEQLSVLQESFFKDLISNRINNKKEFEQCLLSLNIKMNKHNVYCMLVRVNEYHKYENTGEKELITLCKSVKALIQECLEEYLAGYCFEIKTGEFALFFSAVHHDPEYEISDLEIRKTVQTIKEMIDKYLGFTITAGIGKGTAGIRGIRRAFSLAIKALDLARREPEGCCLLWEDLQEHRDNTEGLTRYSVMKYKKDIFLALATHEQDQIENIFKQIIDDVLGKHIAREEYAKIAAEIIYILSEYFNKYDIHPETVLKASFLDFKELHYLESVQQIRCWLESVLVDLNDYLGTDNSLHPKIIERAKDFIRQNYAYQLTLNKIADQIHLNSNYFCSLFKKYEGIGCVDFLNGFRIEQAKKLLKDSDKRIYEIAFQVGFQNNNYFNRLFKRHTGYTPSEYRNLKII